MAKTSTGTKKAAKASQLTPEQLEVLRQKLLDARERIFEQVPDVTGVSAWDEGDEGDKSVALSEADLMWTLEEREIDELKEIDAALQRLENGTYGVCELSGEPIPYDRLEAIPMARYTRESQESLERDD